MKTINEYMKLPYKMEIVEDTIDGGYVISFPELRGCISYGDTIEEAIQMGNDAKLAWFEASLKEGYPIPEPGGNGAYSGQFKLRLPKSLHRELAEHAKLEGISMNQYCLYLLAKNDAIRAR